MASEAGASLYDYLRVKHKIDSKLAKQIPSSQLPQPILKDWKRQWVVITANLSPMRCHISCCNKEEEWLINSATSKHSLKSFQVSRFDTGSKKNEQVIEVTFAQFSLLLMFDSMSKLQLWLDELQKIRTRFFTELVKSPDHPEREREYIMEVCTDTLKLWLPEHENILSFEWRLTHIRRAQFYSLVSKVEIEVGRASETGDGRFYFIGPSMSEMFEQLREKIKTKARAARLIRRGEQVHVRDSGVGSTTDTIELQMETTSVCSGGKEDEDDDCDTGSGGSKTSDVFLPSLPPKLRATSPEVSKHRRLISDKDEVKLTSQGSVEFVSEASRDKKHNGSDGPDYQPRQIPYRASELPPEYSSPVSPPVPLSTHPSSFAISTQASPTHNDRPIPPPPPPPPHHSTVVSQHSFDCDEQYDYQPLSSRTRLPISVYEPLDSQKDRPETRKDIYTTMLPPHSPATQHKNMTYYNTK